MALGATEDVGGDAAEEQGPNRRSFPSPEDEGVDVKPRTVEERQGALEEVHPEYVQEPSMVGGAASTEANGTSATPAADVDLTDEELLEKAQNAANGEKFERLWRGDTSLYESQSEADMALYSILAF